MQAWIVVGSPQNFELLRERGFDLCAFKSSRRKQSSEMQPGDRLVYYLTGDVQCGDNANRIAADDRGDRRDVRGQLGHLAALEGD